MAYGIALVIPFLIVSCNVRMTRLVEHIIYNADLTLMILTRVTIGEKNGII